MKEEHFISNNNPNVGVVSSVFSYERFMKNTNTGVVLPYHPITMATATEMVPIDSQGTLQARRFIDKPTPHMVECSKEEAIQHFRDQEAKKSKKKVSSEELQNILAEIRGEPRTVPMPKR